MTTARDLFLQTFRWALLGLVLLEAVSFWGFLFPDFSSSAFLIFVGVTAVLAAKDLTAAMLVLLCELFVGSQGGYLVAYGTEDGLSLSLRIGLFLAVFGMWAARNAAAFVRPERRATEWRWFGAMRESGLLWPYAALMAAFALAAVRGVLLGNDLGNVFFDANGYAYFALVPAIVAALAERSAFVRVGGALAASIVTSVAKALYVEFLFSHRQFFYAKEVYVWVRDTRVGEITIMGGDFYRVFFQSQIWLLFAAFPLLLALAYFRRWRPDGSRWGDRHAWLAFGLLTLCATSMLLSLSRSFWFGAAVATLGLVGALIWAKATKAVWWRGVGAGVAAIVAGFLLIIGLYASPWPAKTGEFDFAGFLGGRAFSFAGEAAANSRWALLPLLHDAILEHPLLGSGFGRTVTYKTSDPRLLADIPTGEYTTFAFEWGYHDLFVKLGFVGVAAYGWFLVAVLRPLVRRVRAAREAYREPKLPEDDAQFEALMILGALIGILAMLATNLFSPYLNHPLGIGMLGLAAAWGAVDRGLQVRRARPEDAEAMATLHRVSWLSTYVNEEAGITATDITRFLGDHEERVGRWKMQLGKEGSGGMRRTFVAERGDRIVGIGVAVKKEDAGLIHALYVDPAHFRGGVGTALMRCCLEWLDAGRPVLVHVASFNERAMRFYERLGFVHGWEGEPLDLGGGVSMPQTIMKRVP